MRSYTACSIAFVSFAAAIPYAPSFTNDFPTTVHVTTTVHATATVYQSLGVFPPYNQTSPKSCSSDGFVLNQALRIFQLGSALHAEGLGRYSPADLPNNYTSIQSIASAESFRIGQLTATIQDGGCVPLSPCNYTFPYSSPTEFLALSSLLDGVSASAYLGASRVYATLSHYFEPLRPFSMGVPLYANEVTSLLANFVDTCPVSNASHPVKIYPQLLVGPIGGKPRVQDMYARTFPAGSVVQIRSPQLSTSSGSFLRRARGATAGRQALSYPNYYTTALTAAPNNTATASARPTGSPSGGYGNSTAPYSNLTICAAFLTAESSIKIPLAPLPSDSGVNGAAWSVALPGELAVGQNYVVLVPCSASTICDRSILAGPAAIQIGDNKSPNGGDEGATGGGAAAGDGAVPSVPGHGGSSSNGGSSSHGGSSSTGGSSSNGGPSSNGGSSSHGGSSGHGGSSSPGEPYASVSSSDGSYNHDGSSNGGSSNGGSSNGGSSNGGSSNGGSSHSGSTNETLPSTSCPPNSLPPPPPPTRPTSRPYYPGFNQTHHVNSTGYTIPHPTSPHRNATLPAPPCPAAGTPSYGTYTNGTLAATTPMTTPCAGAGTAAGTVTGTRFVYHGYTTITSTGPTPSPTRGAAGAGIYR